MKSMNAQMNPAQMQATMDAFARENMKMDMTDELITSTLDDIMAGWFGGTVDSRVLYQLS